MNRYNKKRSFRAPNPYIKSKVAYTTTKKLDNHIRSVVAKSQAIQVRYPRTDPPGFVHDRTWRRMVRIPTSSSTSIFPKRIADTELEYYGLPTGNTQRWQGLKLLSATFYGTEDVDEIQVQYVGTAGGAQTATTLYSDAGDKNHRPCIKLIMPPTMTVQTVGGTNPFFTFLSGTVDFVDCYVEFH